MNKIIGVVSRSMDGQRPSDSEVREKTKRRNFSAARMRGILQEAANCKQDELVALLREKAFILLILVVAASKSPAMLATIEL